MATQTLRLPESCYNAAFESDAVADAGIMVKAPTYTPGLPKDTGWVSFRVDTPAPMDARTLVRTLANLCGR